MNLNGADKRLINTAVAFYIVLEIIVIVYIGIWISRGY